jgi:transcriptional regulator with XRE-family HTH domain
MDGELARRIGRYLADYRRARGLSQEAFAEVLGFHRTYVGGLERGERNLSLRTVEHLAEALKVDPLAMMAPRTRR